MATYTVTYKKSNFSKKEVQDIVISVVTLSVALFLIIYRTTFKVNGVPLKLPILSALGIGFLMTITAFLVRNGVGGHLAMKSILIYNLSSLF